MKITILILPCPNNTTIAVGARQERYFDENNNFNPAVPQQYNDCCRGTAREIFW
ncbi:hypothetical protein [Microseira wollei]|uniref:hypothetical protein n=1 Tax=Microseira wollei TaxID=467598 RepID=UPI001CFF3613|nr:hypothetical protein [Microseira wollei]